VRAANGYRRSAFRCLDDYSGSLSQWSLRLLFTHQQIDLIRLVSDTRLPHEKFWYPPFRIVGGKEG